MPDTPSLPSDYAEFLQAIKQQVRTAQIRALVRVNTELISLYWQIGINIIERQSKEGWGTGVMQQLSRDLHAAFPQMKGFSVRNLGYMKSFALAYPDEAILQQPAAKLPWYHHCVLLEKVKDEKERMWYMHKSAENGWSRNILVLQIETDLYHRSGKAITNFGSSIPELNSDLAQDVLKDPYVFDFITTSDETKERHIQSALLAHIEHFLLELGVGFTFVGSNYHLAVGDEDFYLDLLFYHIRLRRYVVIELKTGTFKPEYAGKLNFYLTAVDEQLKQPEDNSTIGIILCKSKNKTTAEYALRDIQKPIGVASYTTTQLPASLKGQLPDIKELELSIERIQGKGEMTVNLEVEEPYDDNKQQ